MGLYVDAGANVELEAQSGLNIWAKPNTSTNGQRIYDNGKTQMYLDGTNQIIVSKDGATLLTSNAIIAANGAWGMGHFASDAAGLSNIYIGSKTTDVALAQASPNTTAGTPAAGTTNLIIANSNAGTNPFDGYLLYQIVYKEDTSNSNADISAIQQIQNATKSLIP